MKPSFTTLTRLTCVGLLVLISTAFWVNNRQPESTLQAAQMKTLPEVNPSFLTHRKEAGAQLKRAHKEEQQTALNDLMADKPFVLVSDGRPQRFILSLSEFYLPKAKASEKHRQIAHQSSARELISTAEKAAGSEVGWILYPENHVGEAAYRHVLKKRILIQTSDRAAALATLSNLGLKLVSEPEYAPGHLIVEPISGGPEAVLRALANLSQSKAIDSAGPLLSRQHAKFWTPDDRLFNQQWHLKNTGQGGSLKGFDMKVTTAWDNYKGTDVRIGIVDDGLEIDHPDLSPNVDNALHYDWNDDTYDQDPTPNPIYDDTHGTSVGGVAAARGGNGIGVSGVAPEARLVGLRLISSEDFDGTSDEEDAEAMAHRNDVIDIKNSSWGTTAEANEVYAAGPLIEAARKNGTLTGRDGKGTIYVWAAGNYRDYGEQGQKDGVTSSIYVNTVGALNNKGGASFYSEGGSHIIVSAPSNGGSRGIHTTDLTGRDGYNKRGTAQGEPSELNYTDSFGGTSSASPAVAGMIALMLDANPNLNWRDVKEILLRSSTKIIPTSPDWISHPGGRPSLPPIKHHHIVGGGAANATAAVAMAAEWQSLGPMIEASRSDSDFTFIPDNNPAGISIQFDFSATAPMRVEHAKLQFNVTHSFRGDLEILLTSPEGIVSRLADAQSRDNGDDYVDWIFNSVRHWGESARGIWTLTIRDRARLDSGFYENATLTLYGSSAPAINITSQSTGVRFIEDGQPLNLNVQASAGSGSVDYLWERDGQKINQTGSSISIPAATYSMGGEYTVTVSNVSSSDDSDVMPVGIVRRTLPDLIINEGKSLSLPVLAQGPGLSYQWKHNGVELNDGGNISGTQSPTLMISDMQIENAGGYTCVISMAGTATTIETQPANVTIRFKPVVVPPATDNGVISGVESRQFTALNGATRFSVGKLPPGVTFNSTTGLLSGRPTRAGIYNLSITATNQAGPSETLSYRWQIEDFPLAARGSWRGTAERTSLNAGFGGRVTLTIAKTGSYSGRLTLGSKSYSWSGRINALPNNQTSTTPLNIRRGSGLSALVGSLTLNLTDGLLTGSITDGSFTSSLSGTRQSWTSANRPVSVLTTYNTALESPASVLNNPLYPQGNGYVVHKLSPSGSVSSTGKLADGTSFTHSTHLGSSGQLLLHAMINNNTGSLQGDSTLQLETALISGGLSWFKKEQASSRHYLAGIPLHTLSVRGARYTQPTGMIIGLDTPVNTPPDDNAKLRFSGLPLNPMYEYTFLISSTNVPRIPTSISANTQKVQMKLDPKTGLFSGSFFISTPDPRDVTEPISYLPRTPTFQGLLVTHPELTAGVGFFQINELPDTVDEKLSTTPIQSGKMELTRP